MKGVDRETANRLILCEQVLNEVLRLTPPVSIIEREAAETTELCGQTIYKGQAQSSTINEIKLLKATILAFLGCILFEPEPLLTLCSVFGLFPQTFIFHYFFFFLLLFFFQLILFWS